MKHIPILALVCALAACSSTRDSKRGESSKKKAEREEKEYITARAEADATWRIGAREFIKTPEGDPATNGFADYFASYELVKVPAPSLNPGAAPWVEVEKLDPLSEAASKRLDESKPIFDAVRAGNAKPRVTYPVLDWTPNLEVQPLRPDSELLRWAAPVALFDLLARREEANGNLDGAIEAWGAAFRYATRLCDSNSSIQQRFFSLGMRGRASRPMAALVSGPKPTAAQAKSIQQIIETNLDPALPLTRAVENDFTAGKALLPSFHAELAKDGSRGLLPLDKLRETYESMGRLYLDSYGKPYSPSAEKKLERNIEPRFNALGMLVMILPGTMNRGRIGDLLSQAQTRMACVAAALRAEKAEHGVWPASLESLTTPPETKIDPFTGKPFVLTLKDGAAILYSVGPDQADQQKRSGVPLLHMSKPTDDIVLKLE